MGNGAACLVKSDFMLCWGSASSSSYSAVAHCCSLTGWDSGSALLVA